MWLKEKKELTTQEHWNSLERMRKLKTPEEARRFHKEMRKYKNGPRLPLFTRYPNFPLYIESISSTITILVVIYAVVTKIF